MYSEERRKLIVDLVNKEINVSVNDLCKTFSASAGTIRNDLKVLDQMGLLKRTHGGAISLSRIAFEPMTDEKEILFQSEKRAVATKALDFINDGDTLALDTGTSMLELARKLGSKKRLNVVTNDLKIALELERHETITVILTGGVLRSGFHCTIGPKASQALSELRVDKAFIAANGVSVSAGISTPNLDIAEIKRSFIQMAREVYLLCDSSKIGQVSFMRIASIQEITAVITDDNLDRSLEKEMIAAEVPYHLATLSREPMLATDPASKPIDAMRGTGPEASALES